MVKKQKGKKVKFLRSDNESEYTSTEFKEYLVSEGIDNKLSIPGHPEQHRVIKRMNQTLAERAYRGYKMTCQKVSRQRH